MGYVYRMTLQQLSGRWRLLVMTVLAAMPVLIAVLMLHSGDAPSVEEFESAILSAMLAGSIAPLVVLAIAAPAFANEIEDRTLANLVLRRALSKSNNRAHRLVAEDKGFPYHEGADASFFVVVDVGAADADGPDLDHHFFGSRFGDRHILQPDVVRTVHDRRFVLHRAGPF